MDRIAALSTGAKLLLAGGLLLLVDLFMTWQKIALDFGPGTEVTKNLDAWDFWGLLIGLLTIGLVAGVIFRVSNDEFALGSRWELVTLVVSSVVLAIVVLKNLRDSDSTWASYLGVVLAGIMTAGAVLDWTRARSEQGSVSTAWWAQPAVPSAPASVDPEESRPRW